MVLSSRRHNSRKTFKPSCEQLEGRQLLSSISPQLPNTWVTVAPLPTARDGLAAAAGSDGRIYAIGGTNNTGVTSEVDAYTPSTNAWTQVASLPSIRGNLAAATGKDGTIYAIGGIGPLGITNEVDAYNPTNNTWTKVASLPTARDNLTAVAGPDGTIYAIGGTLGSPTSEVDAYNPTNNTWTKVASLPTARYSLEASIGSDGRIYAIGGYTSGLLVSEVDAYNITTNTWTKITSLPNLIVESGAATGPDGRTYAIGRAFGGTTSEVDAYNPFTNAWTQVASMPNTRDGLAAVAGLDGRIYAIGGNGPTSEVDAYAPVTTKTAPSITWANPVNITYGTPLSTTQLDATANVQGTFSYSTNPVGIVLNAGQGQTLSTTFTPTDTIDYSSVGATTTINVAQAPLTITADNQIKVYGQANPTLTGSITGLVNGDNITATFSTTATASSPIGAYAITPTATDPNNRLGNYTVDYINGTLTVTPAALTITANNQTMVYGAALPTLIASYSGFVNGDTAVSLTTQPTLSTTATAASPVAGSPYAITASGAVDSNYSITYVNGTLTVTPAPLTVTANNATKVYGTPNPPLTGTITGLVNGDTDTATFSTDATASSPVGTYAITPSLSDSNYSITYVNGVLSVTPATPVVTWASPADITYGTPLGPAQLDATASVLGTFTYTPTAGTVLHPGVGQTLSVTFIPTDTTDYNSVVATTAIDVLKATPVVAWPNPADITYGTPLGAAQLDATTSVAGTFAYTPGAGTVLNAGQGQTLSVTFTPTDTADYNSVTATAAINVLKATQVVSWASPADIIYGTPLGAAQLDATASVPGSFTYTPVAGTILNAGQGQTLSATFTPTDTIDYNTVTAAVQINVTPAPLTITANNATKVYGQANPPLTGVITGLVNGDTDIATYSTTATTRACYEL